MNTHLQTIINKMCEYVGIESVDTKKDGWFLEYSWTTEQQDEFRDWYVEFIKDMKIQRELYEFARKSKKSRIDKANMFIMNYGWRVERIIDEVE